MWSKKGCVLCMCLCTYIKNSNVKISTGWQKVNMMFRVLFFFWIKMYMFHVLIIVGKFTNNMEKVLVSLQNHPSERKSLLTAWYIISRCFYALLRMQSIKNTNEIIHCSTGYTDKFPLRCIKATLFFNKCILFHSME